MEGTPPWRQCRPPYFVNSPPVEGGTRLGARCARGSLWIIPTEAR
jgi:hypothetical protein